MSWMLVLNIILLVAFILILIYWFLRVRSEMVKKGYKYTAISIPFTWIVIGLFNGTRVLFIELSILQVGSIIDEIALYALVILVWVSLAALSISIIVDLVKRSCSSKPM